MLLLARPAYKMNDSLEKMYPFLKSIKHAGVWYMERIIGEDSLMKTYDEIFREVAEAVYLDWTISTLGIAAVHEVEFKDLSVSKQEVFMQCAKIIMNIVEKDHAKLVRPLRKEDRPRKPRMQFIRAVREPVLIALEVGDYATIQRANQEERI